MRAFPLPPLTTAAACRLQAPQANQAAMAPRRRLSPQSVWDSEAVTAAFEAAGANTKHIPRL